ncbi:hypothetical protein Tco_0409602 [Tanacetum coccineum]
MKDQPLSADASPTALSPGYIADSDPEEDKEDPEEDPERMYPNILHDFLILYTLSFYSSILVFSAIQQHLFSYTATS